MARRFAMSACWGSIAVLSCLVDPAGAQIDPQRADAYFREAKALCERDGGRLWGVSLCGPMVFGDARTRTIVTSGPRPAVEPPRIIGLTNAPVAWGDSTWAAYMWDFTVSLPDARVRHEFMLHELFHRIQNGLGLVPLGGPARAGNEHLDTVEGRVWLRLEWRALAQALIVSGADRIRAVRDAAAFRSARRALAPTAAESERGEEIREGLAQYTGTVVAASSRAEAVASAVLHLVGAEGHETFLQQAYTTGVAYAMLLDDASPGWRRRVRGDSDLGRMLAAALSIAPTPDMAAASARYGGPDLRVTERTRAERREAVVRDLRKRFVEDPILLVPARGGASFNAVGAVPIPGAGTVYFSRYATSSEWGTLDATQGVLVRGDGARQLAGPFRIEGLTISGDGWTVTVGEGWAVRPGPRPEDRQLVRNSP